MSSSTWRLGDVAKKIGSGATPRGGRSVYGNGSTRLIRSQNVYNDRFERESLVLIGDEHAAQLAGVSVEADDILINITGESVARVNLAPSDVLPARVNQHVAIIRPDPEVLDPRFLRYWLISPNVQARLHQLSSAGATRRALTKGMLEDLVVPRRPLHEQAAVAELLGALDDKVHLNRGLARNLDDLCAVRFSVLVEGAAQLPATELVKFNPKISLQRGNEYPFIEMAAVPAWDPAPNDSNKSFKGGGSRFAGKDTLLARITPSLEHGKTAYVGFLEEHETGFGSTEFIVMRATRKSNPGYVFYLARSPAFRDHAIKNMTGSSGRQRVPVDSLAGFLVPAPAGDAMTDFGEFSESALEGIQTLREENLSLSSIRDALLPDLISGRLRIDDAELLVEEAV